MNPDARYISQTKVWITQLENMLSHLEARSADPRVRLFRDATASQLESLRHDLELAMSGIHANQLPEDDSVPSLQPLPPRGANMHGLSRSAAIDQLRHEIEQ